MTGVTHEPVVERLTGRRSLDTIGRSGAGIDEATR